MPIPHEGEGLSDEAIGLTTQSLSPGQLAFRRYLHHKPAVICTVVLAILVLFVLLAPFTARYGVNEQVFPTSRERPNSFLPPSRIAWFGTDAIGRDLYTRMIYGLRVSLIIGLAAAVFATIIGVSLGALAGLRGGRIDNALMRVTDLFLAYPFLVALLVVRSFLGGVAWLEPIIGSVTSIRFVIVLFVVFSWMGVARLMRGQVMSLKEREFIEASRATGSGSLRIVLRHLLPNSIGPILVALTTAVAATVVGEATLSFFGYGPQPGSGQTSLGKLVAESKSAVLAGYWWLVVFPCGLLVLVTLCVNFIGDGLRDATDPKLDTGGQ
jgi:peptide/nickel transport system permease protein